MKDYIYPPAVEELKKRAEVVDNWDRIGEIDAIIARGTKITADIIEKATNLKVIAKHGIGVNTIDVEAATKRGIPVINTPLSNADSVAELTVALFLMLERSDLVNVNVPLVKSTKNLVSREAMAHFKPGSVFVNAARGEVIDEDALYDALVEGRLRAAACDTFVEEPVSPTNPLLTLRNFSATPHLGGNTEEALQKTGTQVVRDTLSVLAGDFSTAHRVN